MALSRFEIDRRTEQVFRAFKHLPEVLRHPVSLNDVARAVGLPLPSVYTVTKRLMKQGRLGKLPGVQRSWFVTEAANV